MSKVPLSGISFLNTALSKFTDLNSTIIEQEIAKFGKARADELQVEMKRAEKERRREAKEMGYRLEEQKKLEGGLLRQIQDQRVQLL